MPDRQFAVGAGNIGTGAKIGIVLKQTQDGVLHQAFGVGAGVGGDLREPRFLLGCEMDFHALRILENGRLSNGWGPLSK
jgi:hypothetical protein